MVNVSVEQSPLRCPWCHSGIELARDAWVACAACLARHHAECWQEALRCAACAHSQRLERAAPATTPLPDFVSSVFGPDAEPRVAPARRQTGKLKGDAAWKDTEPAGKPGSVWPTLHVSKGPSGQFRTIGEAIRAAKPGTRIVVAPGVYQEALVLDRPVAILGGGPVSEVVLESAHEDAVALRTEVALVRGLTIRACGPSHANFAAVRIPGGQLRVWDCDLTSSSVYPCVLVTGAEAYAVLRRCRVHDGHGAGLLFDAGATAVVHDCEVAGNRQYGIGVRTGARPVIQGSTIQGGATGAFVSEGGLGRFKECDFFGSEVGVRLETHGNPVLERCKVHENGVGIHAFETAEGTIDDTRVYANAGPGLLVERRAHPLVKWCKVSEGRDVGVRVTANGEGRFEDCTIVENALAGVSVTLGGSPALERCKVRRNGGAGVSVRDGGGARVEECDLTDNARGAWDLGMDARVHRRNNRD